MLMVWTASLCPLFHIMMLPLMVYLTTVSLTLDWMLSFCISDLTPVSSAMRRIFGSVASFLSK